MMATGSVTAPMETPPPSRPLAGLKAPSDPGFAALRRAARAAIIIPLAFAFGQLVLHDTQNVIFVVFGGFALLVMSDFGGPRSVRALAYVTATLVGAVLIALGTVVSQTTALAGAVMLLVGFAISFASVFGGYVAAAQTGLLLAFVISVSVPAPAGAVPARVAGWAFAGILATLAGVFLWPRFEQARSVTLSGIEQTDRLIAAFVASLRSSADILTGGRPPDLRAVEEARERHRAALDHWAAKELRAGRPVDQVLDGLDVDHTLRVVSYLAMSLGSNAVIAAGGRPEEEIVLPVSAPRLEGLSGTATRVLRTVRTHLKPSSTVLQRSLRVAVGLALAVLPARILGLSHAFWVVLGTLQVLRSTALGTGRTTLEALAGNVIGVVIGGIFAVLAGNHPAVMWIALPFAIFLASYAATTVGFIASQAAFTINLIIIFNLISPAGWQVGLVRIEDVAVGATISIVVGLLLWPRGARREFGRAVAGFYRAVATYLEAAFDRVLDFEPPASLDPARRVADQARDRAREAFDASLNERAAAPPAS